MHNVKLFTIIFQFLLEVFIPPKLQTPMVDALEKNELRVPRMLALQMENRLCVCVCAICLKPSLCSPKVESPCLVCPDGATFGDKVDGEGITLTCSGMIPCRAT